MNMIIDSYTSFITFIFEYCILFIIGKITTNQPLLLSRQLQKNEKIGGEFTIYTC